jgi:hypothetical protein
VPFVHGIIRVGSIALFIKFIALFNIILATRMSDIFLIVGSDFRGFTADSAIVLVFLPRYKIFSKMQLRASYMPGGEQY